jgi:hypothetical protein
MDEWTLTIKGHALDAAEFPFDVIDADFAFGTLLMLARLVGFLREEQGTWEALGARAVGLGEWNGGMHGQDDGATGSAISRASKGRRRRRSQRNSGDAMVPGSSLMDVPHIGGGITDEGGGELGEGNDGLIGKRTERHDVIPGKGLSVFGEDNISILGTDGSSKASARAPEEFLLFFGRAISVFLIGAACDTQAAVRASRETIRAIRARERNASLLGGVPSPIGSHAMVRGLQAVGRSTSPLLGSTGKPLGRIVSSPFFTQTPRRPVHGCVTTSRRTARRSVTPW